MYTKDTYEWEKEEFVPENDPFMRHFDENGNFIETLPDEIEETPDDVSSKNPSIKVQYVYIDKSKESEE